MGRVQVNTGSASLKALRLVSPLPSLRTRTIPKRPPTVVWVEYHAPECGYANRVHTSGRALGVVVCTCSPVAYKYTIAKRSK